MKIQCADYQYDVLNCRARFIAFMAGRRVGKSFCFMVRSVGQCLNNNKFRYWYITPAYAQCKEVFENICAQDWLRNYILKTVMQPYPLIIFRNGSRIAFRTFERPKNLRGSGLDEVWVDEIQDIREADFWPVIRPLISDRQGNLIISGQFRGYNWYHDQLYLPGLDDEQAEYKSYRIPSSRGLVFQSDAGRRDLEHAKQQIPRVIFEQEYECLPVANQDAVWDAEDIEASKAGDFLEQDQQSGKKYIVGVDLGTSADPTGITVVNPYDRESGHVVYSELRPLKEKHSKIAQRVEAIRVKFNARLVMVDTTGGATGGQAIADTVVRYYKKYVKNLKCFNWNRRNKAEAVRNLSLAFENKKITIAAGNSSLLSEVQLYEVKRSGEHETYQGPGGKRDNLTTALLIAWVAVQRNWFNRGGTDIGAENLSGVVL